MNRNRYNYPKPPTRDIKGKETQTRNNWTLMETSLAESQTDSYFPTKCPNGYPKQKDVSDTHIQRRAIIKIKHDRRIALERSVKNISLAGVGSGGGGERGRWGREGLNRFYEWSQSSPLLQPRFRHIICSVRMKASELISATSPRTQKINKLQK